MSCISKGTGISKAQLREQKIKAMFTDAKPIPKVIPASKPMQRVRQTPKILDPELYTTKGTLRKAGSPLDKTFKSDTHFKIKATGELIEKVLWRKQEAARRVTLRIENMCCARCGRKRKSPDIVTCESCSERSKTRNKGKTNISFHINSEIFQKINTLGGTVPKLAQKLLLEWYDTNKDLM